MSVKCYYGKSHSPIQSCSYSNESASSQTSSATIKSFVKATHTTKLLNFVPKNIKLGSILQQLFETDHLGSLTVVLLGNASSTLGASFTKLMCIFMSKLSVQQIIKEVINVYQLAKILLMTEHLQAVESGNVSVAARIQTLSSQLSTHWKDTQIVFYGTPFVTKITMF